MRHEDSTLVIQNRVFSLAKENGGIADLCDIVNVCLMEGVSCSKCPVNKKDPTGGFTSIRADKSIDYEKVIDELKLLTVLIPETLIPLSDYREFGGDD